MPESRHHCLFSGTGNAPLRHQTSDYGASIWQAMCSLRGDMSEIAKLWLATTAVLALFGAGLEGLRVVRWTHPLNWVLLMVLASAILALLMYRWWHRTAYAAQPEPDADLPGKEEIAEVPPGESSNGAGYPAIRHELALAADHVHSIRILLEVSRSHDQPIPLSVLRNLELVGKHLRELESRSPEAAAESACGILR